MIASELAASKEYQIYGQSVKYFNEICLPELIHLKKKKHTHTPPKKKGKKTTDILLKCHGILPVGNKACCYQREIC